MPRVIRFRMLWYHAKIFWNVGECFQHSGRTVSMPLFTIISRVLCILKRTESLNWKEITEHSGLVFYLFYIKWWSVLESIWRYWHQTNGFCKIVICTWRYSILKCGRMLPNPVSGRMFSMSLFITCTLESNVHL